MLAINLALLMKFNLRDMVFVISSQFVPVPVTSHSIGTEKVMYFFIILCKKVNCPSNFSISTFMIKS